MMTRELNGTISSIADSRQTLPWDSTSGLGRIVTLFSVNMAAQKSPEWKNVSPFVSPRTKMTPKPPRQLVNSFR